MSHAQQHPDTSELPTTTAQLNHTVVYATDRHLSAEFLAAVLELKVGAPSAPSFPSTSATA